MQLKTQTDYAIRILAHLTKNSHYVSRRKDLRQRFQVTTVDREN